jgi:hypothetical protein
LNYGAAKDLQLTLVVPLGYSRDLAGSRMGAGDVEMSAKYRFIHQTAESSDSAATTVLALGIIYKLTEHWALMASGGPGLQNTREAGREAFYVSLQQLD